MPETQLLHLRWDDVQSLSVKVAEAIKKDGYKPDLIAAVSRGGFDPARILCDQLGIRRLASLQIEYYVDINETGKSPRIVYPLNTDVNGLTVLVVDDVSDTGISLEVAKDHVLQKGASEVRVATLHVKPWTTLRPDYAAAEVDSWIIYPWEITESMHNMANKLLKDGVSRDKVKGKLVELGFNREDVERFNWDHSKT